MTVRDWVAGPGGTRWLPLAWGFAEATVFFLVPDIAVLLAALTGWRAGLRACGWAVLGALVGGTVVFLVPGAFTAIHVALPGITQGMVDAVRDQVAQQGPWAMVSAPWQGIPYKLYAAEAGHQHLPWQPFLALSVVARLERIFLVVPIGWALGRVLKDPLRRWPRLALPLYVAGWAVVYAVYWASLRGRYAAP